MRWVSLARVDIFFWNWVQVFIYNTKLFELVCEL
jgi:hypothetical protein